MGQSRFTDKSTEGSRPPEHGYPDRDRHGRYRFIARGTRNEEGPGTPGLACCSRLEDQSTFLNIFRGAPQMGHFSGASLSTVFPHTWQT